MVDPSVVHVKIYVVNIYIHSFIHPLTNPFIHPIYSFHSKCMFLPESSFLTSPPSSSSSSSYPSSSPILRSCINCIYLVQIKNCYICLDTKTFKYGFPCHFFWCWRKKFHRWILDISRITKSQIGLFLNSMFHRQDTHFIDGHFIDNKIIDRPFHR